MRALRLLLALMPVLALSRGAEARLAPCTLDELLGASELIVEASPKRLERTGLEAGAATLRIVRVLRGSYEAPEITVTWGDEVHEQSITNLDCDWLLFLKRDAKGQYVAARYGRAYWPFTSRVVDGSRADLDGPGRGFTFAHPLTMVTLSDAQRKALVVAPPPPTVDARAAFIPVKHLIDLLARRQAR